MARYKDCDKCYHRHVCAGDTDKWNYYGECPHYINANDVVPKSEYDRLEKIFNEMTQEAKGYLNRLYGIRADVAREIFEEIEKMLLNNHIGHYKTLKDTWCYNFNNEIISEIAELEKKYTEGGAE